MIWLLIPGVIVYLFITGVVASAWRTSPNGDFMGEDIFFGIIWPVLLVAVLAVAPIWAVVASGVWVQTYPARKRTKAALAEHQRAELVEATARRIKELEAVTGIGDES